jgi:hypothetical protein
MPLALCLLTFMTPEVKAAAESALAAAGMTMQSMNFQRHWSSSVAMPDSLVLAVLEDVWLLPETAMEHLESRRALLSPIPGGGFGELLEVLENTDSEYAALVEGMGTGLADSLTLVLSYLWADGDSLLPGMEWGGCYTVRGMDIPWEYTEIHPESLSVLLERWNAPQNPGLDTMLSLAVSASGRWAGSGAFPSVLPGVDGNVVAWSLDDPVPWVVGGPGPNGYGSDCPFRLILDLGGDDRYGPGVGGVMGVAGKGYVSVVVDCSGNDTWDSEGFPVSQGGAVLGFACVVDLAGDDVYRASGLAQGSGMMGSGYLADLEGNDLCLASVHCQGAGTLGLGTLLDVSGDDLRKAASFAQGFGGPGGRGELLDGAGHDVYLAGFTIPHEPLLPSDHRAMSQGFGMGLRPFIAGGTGVLLDYGDGCDTYRAEVFGQGCSYWYSLGMLVDEGGQDVYSAAQYSQGTGIHLSAGVLVDLAGDDQYISRNGPAQGSAHDLSTGFLLDRRGNDYYATDGGQGLALTNSAAVFADLEGTDVFAVRNLGQGQATWARGSSGSGLFLSMADDDSYMGRGSDSLSWTEDYSAGLDLALTTPEDPEFQDPVGDPASLELDSLFRVASEWGVGCNRDRVQAHLDELVSRGDAAVEYVLAEHLDSWDGLEHRAIIEVLKGRRDASLGILLGLLEGGSLEGRRFSNAVSWLGEVGEDQARPFIEGLLADTVPPGRAVTVIRALGDIGSDLSVPVILPFARWEDELVRRETAVSLGKIASPLAEETLERLAEDSKLDVMSAARHALDLVRAGQEGLTPQ